ncbi:MAG: hypothetical protein WBI17_05840 [Clostridiaceae bacterium]
MDPGLIRLVFFLLLFLFGGLVYSLLISYFTKNRILRYLPTYVLLVTILYLLYLIYFQELEGFQGLGYLILVFAAVAFIFGNVFTNLMINLYRKNKSRASSK